MAWRTLSVFLLFLNSAAFAWAWFHPLVPKATAQVREPEVPSLILLAERDASAMRASAMLAEVQTPAVPEAKRICARLGPFATRDATASALEKLTPLTLAAQVRETEEQEIRGYWVYLPAFPDREGALTAARQLSAAEVRDYYVVTAGDNENTISLGVFRDAINAEKRMRQIAGLGFYPKRIERGDKIIRFWIDYQAEQAGPLNWNAWLPENVQATPIACA